MLPKAKTLASYSNVQTDFQTGYTTNIANIKESNEGPFLSDIVLFFFFLNQGNLALTFCLLYPVFQTKCSFIEKGKISKQ